ncbi:hypothetical protein LSAT2_031087 [Lamellibrachia satsuma]|nr:hypothetical protein LSAT2_031087 [Lamellibrachia satsuma]
MLHQRPVMTILVVIVCLLPCVSSMLFSGLFKHGELCDGREYNSDFLMCCDESLRPRFSGHKCCGKRGYNPKYALCCLKTVVNHQFWMNCDDYLKQNALLLFTT